MSEFNRQMKLMLSRTEEIFPLSELEAKLRRSLENNIPLKVKLGIDPTGSELHLGHAVPLRKLKQFQELGHSIEFIIGSFTAKIGDPTGKNEARKILTDDEIKKNCATYLDQASNVIDISKIRLHYNGDWLSKLNFEDLLNIMAHFSLSVMMSREDFAKRLKSHTPISLVELTYPLMQAYDSVYLNADIEIGGTDQKFNLLRGRDLQKAFGQEPQICLTLPILEGTNGVEKMSKSLNNYISIRENPNDMFGKVMSIKDELINIYYKLITELNDDQLEEIQFNLSNGLLKPYDAKKTLAEEVVKLYHNQLIAKQARSHFDSLFSNKELIDRDLQEVEISNRKIVSFVSDEAKISKTQARRLLADGAVKMDNVDVDEETELISGKVIKIGKKLFLKLK